jgi:thioesterase domain-containing protein
MLVSGQRWRQIPGFLWGNIFWHLKTALARRKSEGAAAAASGTAGVLEAAVGALECYRVRPYPGHLFLFRAEQTTSTMRTHPQGGWQADEGVEVIDVPGDHLTMLEEPNVRFLAEKIERTLESLQLQPVLQGRSRSAGS